MSSLRSSSWEGVSEARGIFRWKSLMLSVRGLRKGTDLDRLDLDMVLRHDRAFHGPRSDPLPSGYGSAFLKTSGKRMTSTKPFMSSRLRKAIRSPFLVTISFSWLTRPHTSHLIAVLPLGERGGVVAGYLLDLFFIAGQRMACHIKTDRLFFKGDQLLFGKFVHLRVASLPLPSAAPPTCSTGAPLSSSGSTGNAR